MLLQGDHQLLDAGQVRIGMVNLQGGEFSPVANSRGTSPNLFSRAKTRMFWRKYQSTSGLDQIMPRIKSRGMKPC